MKKLAIILALFLAFYSLGYAQTSKIDSLLGFLNSHTVADTIRINALIDLVRSYQKVDLEEGKNIAEEAESLSLEIDYPLGLANSLYNLSFYYWNIGKNDTSIMLCKKALTVFDNINSTEGQLKCYNRIAVNYYLIGDYSKAIDFYYKALGLINSSLDKLEIANLYNNIGVLFADLKEYDKALEYSLKALELKNNVKDSYSIGISLCNVGIFSLRSNNYDGALNYLNQSLKHNLKIKNNYVLSETYEGLGNLYDLLGKYDSAYYYHQKGLDLVLKYGSYGQISRAYNSFGNHYLKQNDLNNALKYGIKALNVGTSEKEQILASHQILFKTYALMHKYKEAYKHLLAYKQIFEELKKDQGLKKLSVHEKELQLKSLEEKVKLEIEYLKKARLLILIALVFSLIVIILITYILVLKSRKNKYLKKVGDTRDQMLKIISHDFRSPLISLGSTLQTIPYLIENKDYETLLKLSYKDSESVSRVLSLIDSLISWTLSQNDNIPYNPDTYSLHEITSFIFELYMPVAAYKKIDFQVKIDQGVKVFADKNILNTILRNLVNNAIKFTPENGKVIVSAEINSNKVKISVKDTGIGIEKDKLDTIFEIREVKKAGTKGEKGSGLGLFFCKEFVSKNKGEIWVESQPGLGSTFTFTVPKAKT